MPWTVVPFSMQFFKALFTQPDNKSLLNILVQFPFVNDTVRKPQEK